MSKNRRKKKPAASGGPASGAGAVKAPAQAPANAPEDASAQAAPSAAPGEKPGQAPEAAPAEAPGQAPAEADAAAPEDAPAASPDAPVEGEAPAEEAPPDAEAQQRRLAEMTRTVQVSVEEIIARMEAASPAAPQPDQAPPPPPLPDAAEEEDPPRRNIFARMGLGVLRGIWGIVKWLLLVVLFVGIIGAAGVYWLYQGATEEMLPQINVTFDGQPLEPTAYTWRVPVINDLVTREYTKESDGTAPALPKTLTGIHPQLTVVPAAYDTRLTIRDEADTEVFSGTVEDFGRYRMAGSGTYRASLVIEDAPETYSGTAAVSGSQTYDFTFTISVRPGVRFDSDTVYQGDVAALMVTGVQEGDIPTLETELKNVGFVPSSNGWIAYLPIARDETPGLYMVRVHTKDYVEDVQLTVRGQNWLARDYAGNSGLISPYLGEEDIPEKVKALFPVYDDEIYWADTAFVEPFSREVAVRLAYGTGEYVGRSAAQREAGTGKGRIALNTVITGKRGDTLSAPADGRVLLAEELDGTGGTVVIEHGGGLKSIFYLLDSIDVTAGDMVQQGDQLGTANGNYIVEARIGAVPVDPLNIWLGKCNAVRCH